MAGLPQFPLKGSSLSQNVGLDRISLCKNDTKNDLFEAGQYVFFIKNNSYWYRFKNSTHPWTNDIFFLPGISEPNTKFDKNGYPVSAYIDSDGYTKVQYYVDGAKTTSVLASGGQFPTVVIDKNDVYVVWVPAGYNTSLNYSQLGDNFTQIHPYSASIPGEILMMNIDVTADQRWLFTFECNVLNKSKIYIAFTNPEFQFATSDLSLFAEFKQGKFLSEYFVITELNQSELLNSITESAELADSPITISDSSTTPKLSVIHQSISNIPEYFIIAQESDVETVLDVLTSYMLKLDLFNVGEGSLPGYELKDIIGHNPIVQDMFEVVLTQALQSQLNRFTNPSDSEETLNIFNPKEDYSLTLRDALPVEIFDNFYVKNNQDSTFTLLVPAVVPTEEPLLDYFTTSDALSEVIFIMVNPIIDYTDGHPTTLNAPDRSDKFYFNQDQLNFILNNQQIHEFEHTESFSIDSVDSLTTFYENFFEKYQEEIVTQEYSTEYQDNLAKHTSFQFESLQIHNILDILFTGETSYSENITELGFLINIGYLPTVNSLISVLNGQNPRDGFSLKESTPTTVKVASVSYRILEDVGDYSFINHINSENDLKMVTFSPTQTVPLYYYYNGTMDVTRDGPKKYNIGISESPIVHFALTLFSPTIA